VLSFRRRFRKQAALPPVTAASDPAISRAGQAVAGMRPGDQRHRPTQAERDLADRVGTSPYDPERRQI
jgi:hypothetical protein